MAALHYDDTINYSLHPDVVLGPINVVCVVCNANKCESPGFCCNGGKVSEVAPLDPATWALVGRPGVVGKVLFLHLGWSSRTGEDGSELGVGTEGRDMFTPVQSFINCLPKGRRAVAWARFPRLQWHPYTVHSQ